MFLINCLPFVKEAPYTSLTVVHLCLTGLSFVTTTPLHKYHEMFMSFNGLQFSQTFLDIRKHPCKLMLGNVISQRIVFSGLDTNDAWPSHMLTQYDISV